MSAKTRVQTKDIEAETWAERTTLTTFSTGERRDATILRVRYRKVGTKRWTKFFVVPDPDQSIEELLERQPEEWAKAHMGLTDQKIGDRSRVDESSGLVVSRHRLSLGVRANLQVAAQPLFPACVERTQQTKSSCHRGGRMSTGLSAFGGYLRCEECGHTAPLGDPDARVFGGVGWPKHCGYTMRWWTQRQINDGEVPVVKPFAESQFSGGDNG